MPVLRWRSFLHRRTEIVGDNKRFEKIAIDEKQIARKQANKEQDTPQRYIPRNKDASNLKHGALEIISSNLCSQNHTSARVSVVLWTLVTPEVLRIVSGFIYINGIETKKKILKDKKGQTGKNYTAKKCKIGFTNIKMWI